MVRSWDNITNKGLIRIKPDKLVVHNEEVEKETLKYEDIKREDIFVGGIPQFDYYARGERTPREDFFRSRGLNPDKKNILVAPHGEA